MKQLGNRLRALRESIGISQAKPPVGEGNPELAQFVEMCFDPSSPMNDKLKKTLLQMLGEAKT